MDIEKLLLLLAGLLGGGVGPKLLEKVLDWIRGAPKDKADMDKLYSEMYKAQTENQKMQIEMTLSILEEQRESLKESNTEVDKLRTEVIPRYANENVELRKVIQDQNETIFNERTEKNNCLNRIKLLEAELSRVKPTGGSRRDEGFR